jgi:thiamine monophosphate kinase
MENEQELKISKLEIDLQMSEIRQKNLLSAFAQLQMNLNKIGVEIGEDYEIILRQDYFDRLR